MSMPMTKREIADALEAALQGAETAYGNLLEVAMDITEHAGDPDRPIEPPSGLLYAVVRAYGHARATADELQSVHLSAGGWLD